MTNLIDFKGFYKLNFILIIIFYLQKYGHM